MLGHPGGIVAEPVGRLGFRRHAGVDLSKVFQQYLETIQIPMLQTKVEGGKLMARWTDAVPGFDMPVDLAPAGSTAWTRVKPTTAWTSTSLPPGDVIVRPDFYVVHKS